VILTPKLCKQAHEKLGSNEDETEEIVPTVARKALAFSDPAPRRLENVTAFSRLYSEIERTHGLSFRLPHAAHAAASHDRKILAGQLGRILPSC
jgi:hypothetical protein